MDLEELFNSMQTYGFDPATYQYFNQLINNRTIIFNCDVQEDLIEKVFIPLREFEQDDSMEPVTIIMNRTTLENFVLDFNRKFYNKIKVWDKKWDDPDWFAQHNGVLMAIGEWLENGEVDIKL